MENQGDDKRAMEGVLRQSNVCRNKKTSNLGSFNRILFEFSFNATTGCIPAKQRSNDH